MAEESAQDKTEYLSAKRSKEAWDKGKIPMGREAPGVAGMMAALVTLTAVAPRLYASLVALSGESLRHAEDGTSASLLPLVLMPALYGFLPIVATALASSAVTLAQTRGHIWTDLAMPDFERLSGGKLMRAFSKEFLVDLLQMVGKVAAVSWVAWTALRDDLVTLPRLIFLPLDGQLAALLMPLSRVTVRVVALLGLFAGVELALAHYRFRQTLKMTKEEAKREAREEDGDPLLKGKRKRRARELAKNRIAVEVPRADAIVVNPTHIAIAIRYRKDEGHAPRVIAKGKGQLAELIRDLARSHGIPIVENIELARLLYKRVKVGRAIPAETFRAVAAVLAFVYRVTGRKPGGGASLTRAA